MGGVILNSIEYVEKIRKFNRFYANVLGNLDQEIYNQPFSLSEARVMAEINDRNGCTATDIRENLGIDRGYMSRMVQRLENENIIIKKQQKEDKRQHTLFLTDYGKGIHNELVVSANIGVTKIVEHLSKSDLSKLLTSMEMIKSIYSKANPPHSEVLIRPFKPGDIGYVAHLHGTLYDKTYKFGKMFEYYVMKGLAEFMINTEGGELWVACVDGELVGSIAITKFNETVAQLRWFVLDENYQGMGIGKKLMETALQFSKEQNYQHVFLWTVSTLKTARYLYQKYNFKLTEVKPNEEWTGTKLIEERWDLDLEDGTT